MKQDTFFDVDEKGTEAAAITSFDVLLSYNPRPERAKIQFNCNRPFWFIIETEDNQPIFIVSKVE